jgi:hypothetical protein
MISNDKESEGVSKRGQARKRIGFRGDRKAKGISREEKLRRLRFVNRPLRAAQRRRIYRRICEKQRVMTWGVTCCSYYDSLLQVVEAVTSFSYYDSVLQVVEAVTSYSYYDSVLQGLDYVMNTQWLPSVNPQFWSSSNDKESEDVSKLRMSSNYKESEDVSNLAHSRMTSCFRGNIKSKIVLREEKFRRLGFLKRSLRTAKRRRIYQRMCENQRVMARAVTCWFHYDSVVPGLDYVVDAQWLLYFEAKFRSVYRQTSSFMLSPINMFCVFFVLVFIAHLLPPMPKFGMGYSSDNSGDGPDFSPDEVVDTEEKKSVDSRERQRVSHPERRASKTLTSDDINKLFFEPNNPIAETIESFRPSLPRVDADKKETKRDAADKKETKRDVDYIEGEQKEGFDRMSTLGFIPSNLDHTAQEKSDSSESVAVYLVASTKESTEERKYSFFFI